MAAKAGAMAIPYGVSLEGLINVIRAWNRAQGYARPLRAEQVAERIETGAKIASRAKVVSNQSSFLIQIGVLVKEGQSNRLTEAGQKVAGAADSPLQEEFNRLMKKLILEWKQVQPLIEFVRNRGKLSRDEMFDRVLEEAKKSKSTTNAVMGGNTFVELLQRVGILVAEDDSVSLAGELLRAAVKPLAPEVIKPAKAPEVPKPVEVPEAIKPKEVLEVPKAVEVPEVPKAVEVPEVPKAVEVPEVPKAVEVPEVPKAVEVPEVPKAVEVPEVIKPKEVLEVPKAVEAPEVPKPVEVLAPPEAVEAPEAIKPVEAPEAPAPKEAPEIIKPAETPEEPTPEEAPEVATPEELPEVPTPEEALEVPIPEEEPEVPTSKETPEASKPVEEPKPAKAVETAEVPTTEEAPEVPKPVEVLAPPEAVEAPEAIKPVEPPEAPAPKEAPEIIKPAETPEEPTPEEAPEVGTPEELPEVPTPEEALEVPIPEEEPEVPTSKETPEASKPVEEPKPAKAVETAEVPTTEEAPEVPKPAEAPEEPTPEKAPEAPTRKELPEVSKPAESPEEQKQERVEESAEEKEHRLPGARYLLGLLVIYLAVYAQYILPSMNLVFGMLLVYGVPIVVIGYFWGRNILHRSLNKMYAAVKYGFASYGGFTALGYLISLVLVILLILFDPSALSLLQNPDPALNATPENAWLLVWLSFLVVGPAEEFLFRGFVYGGLLNMFGNRHWLPLAFLSSVLFAAVHLYYALEYGIVSVIVFTQLITFGMAMAVTYYLSGGNLLIPALIHGLFDATGFLTIAVSLELGTALRLELVFISLAVLLYVSLRRLRSRTVSY